MTKIFKTSSFKSLYIYSILSLLYIIGEWSTLQCCGSDPDPACHFDADPDAACHFDAYPDPDPTFLFDADPDPSFQIKAQNLEKVLE